VLVVLAGSNCGYCCKTPKERSAEVFKKKNDVVDSPEPGVEYEPDMLSESDDFSDSDDPLASDHEDSAEHGRDRLGQALVIISLLVVIAVLVVGFFLLKEVTGEQAPRTAAERAIADYAAQIEADPGNALLYLHLADAYYGAKEYDKALDTLDQVRSMESTGTILAQVLYGTGRIEEARGDNEAAIAAYLDSLKVKELAETRYALARIYHLNEQYGDAVEQYRTYLETMPTDASGWRGLGDALEKQGDKEAALEAYRQAATFLPDDDEISSAISRLEGGE
jgi:tetratricopeptide (TPR) repeat protein